MRTKPTLMAFLVMMTSGIAGPAIAQVERSGGGESQKILQQYQQLAAERTSLQAEVAQQKKDLDAAKADLAAMTKARDALKTRAGGTAAAVAAANSEKAAAVQSLEQSKQHLGDLVTRFREMAGNLKAVELDRDQARKELTARNSAFDQCAENNMGLYDISVEVLNRYERVGLFTKVSASEPFTKLTRTRLENMAVEYRARADELRLKKAAH